MSREVSPSSRFHRPSSAAGGRGWSRLGRSHGDGDGRNRPGHREAAPALATLPGRAKHLSVDCVLCGRGSKSPDPEEFVPKRHRHWIPSATGLGIAGVIPAFNSIAMFLGALVAWTLSKQAPKLDEKYTVAVSSGLIAGESLMAVAIMLFGEGPQLFKTLLGIGR